MMKKSSIVRLQTSFFFLFYIMFLPTCGATPPLAIPSSSPQKISSSCIPEFFCSTLPQVGPPAFWRHRHQSSVIASTGSARHRGIDLITSVISKEQKIQGELHYGLWDKNLEEEDVEVFACNGKDWHLLGQATTDSHGLFSLILSGENKLPLGKYPLFVSVKGDRSHFFMLALILPQGGKIVVSDIDGTLTGSENAYPKSIITEVLVIAHKGAKEALTAFAQKCYYPIYVTARGRRFTASTHHWLLEQGFPDGPLRLAPSLLTYPGQETLTYKSNILKQILDTGVEIIAGIGNRASDIFAYQKAHIPFIFIKRPEFDEETIPHFEKKQAIGFYQYEELLPYIQKIP